jgi:hypothetical protein
MLTLKNHFQNETAMIVTVQFNHSQMIRNLISSDTKMWTQDIRTITEILVSRDDVKMLKLIHYQRNIFYYTNFPTKSFHWLYLGFH